jgi:hypothetical protein
MRYCVTQEIVMASNAERQRAYRERHAGQGGGRINMAVSAHAEAALRRLAAHQGLTARAMLERLLTEAEGELVQGLPAKAQKQYYAVTQ